MRGRRKSGKVEAQTPGECSPVRFAYRLECLFFQLDVDEVIDSSGAAGSLRPLGLNVGPVRLVFGSLLNPLSEQIFLLSAELLAAEERRHYAGLIAGIDTLYELAGASVSRFDCASLDRYLSAV